jgi:hypothetical protein
MTREPNVSQPGAHGQEYPVDGAGARSVGAEVAQGAIDGSDANPCTADQAAFSRAGAG